MKGRPSMTRDRRGAPRFGVEEEFLLLDAVTGMPSDGADQLVSVLAGKAGLRAEYEFFHSQLETATPVCEHASQAFAALGEFRVAAAQAAAEHGLVLAGTGSPPVGGEIPGRVTDNARYREIHATMRGMVHRYYSTGTHVHIEVPSRDAGVDVMNRIARWSPVLIALTANSPLWYGEDSGYASWRYLQLQQWPSSGYPPEFASATEYEAAVDGLVGAGALMDKALVNWSIRLSEKFPTVELRTADAQLASEDAVVLGLLLRALVHRALEERASGAPLLAVQRDLLRGAHWVAARNGLRSELVDPHAGVPRPAFDVISDLVDYLLPSLEVSGDLVHVERFLAKRRADLGGATLQLAAWDGGGMPALLELYRLGSQPA